MIPFTLSGLFSILSSTQSTPPRLITDSAMPFGPIMSWHPRFRGKGHRYSDPPSTCGRVRFPLKIKFSTRHRRPTLPSYSTIKHGSAFSLVSNPGG
ncbi:hypothetical protein CEXT_322781 [Caerostris extrusa]|uniref:Secreted protein n=1 Tax=Caerostris extrusa TaxID=172846 RepID=A0AAV4Y7D1_CAEEX|nr:hypothetical protein CEXT_322781 [Caerostris extrusa]